MSIRNFIRVVLLVIIATETLCFLAIADVFQGRHIWWQWALIMALLLGLNFCAFYVRLPWLSIAPLNRDRISPGSYGANTYLLEAIEKLIEVKIRESQRPA